MNVLDASVLSKFILKEEGWREASNYVASAVSVDHVVKEVSNAIWKAYRRKLIDFRDAERKFSAFISLLHVNLRLVDEGELIPQAFELAMRTNLTIYDSLYVVLAKREGLPLVTSDELQGSVANNEGVGVILV